MKPPLQIRHEFVEFVPEDLEKGILYISIPFATVVHSCFCGCGLKVVTPLSPVGWQLIFDGETVSLWPSVGNWSFPCRSHYIIRKDAVAWAHNMTEDEIEWGRRRDRTARRQHYDGKPAAGAVSATDASTPRSPSGKPLWDWFIGDGT